MSFPKAKIHRFNEVQNPTPSPADYNVHIKSHVSGAAIAKSGRFTVFRSPASSEGGSYVSQNSVPTFRTPNPPRKLHQVNKLKPMELFQSDGAPDLEALKEKIVECNNKDQYIRELIEQVEELKLQAGEFQASILTFGDEKARLEADLAATHKRCEKDSEALHDGLSVLSNKIVLMKEEHNKVKDESHRNLKSLLGNINRLEQFQKSLLASYNQEREELEVQKKRLEDRAAALQEEHLQQIEAVRKRHQHEIEEMQSETLGTVTELQQQLDQVKQNCLKETEKLRAEFEHERTELDEDHEAKIKQMEENHRDANILAEIQAQERCEDIESSWRMKLEEATRETDAILKECQAIAEYNIIQCEVEKNKAVYDLGEEKKASERLRTEVESELELLRGQNASSQGKLASLTEEIETQTGIIARADKDRHTYEVTITKTHSTIEALKRRLLHSDRDVEQLKAELVATEVSKLECEEKCNRLVEELQLVTDLFDNAKLPEVRRDVEEMEEKLLAKVEQFRIAADEEVRGTKEKLDRTQIELMEAVAHLREQHLLNQEAQLLVAQSEREIARLEAAHGAARDELATLKLTEGARAETLTDESAQLEAALDAARNNERSLREQLEEFKGKRADSEVERSKSYESALDCLEKERQQNEGLRKKIAEQEALIKPFREHLEAYEMEYRALVGQKQNAEKEAKEMGLKYAQILGHQNQKQKIKHLMDLKNKNYELLEDKKELEHKIRLQSRTIEKLKKELSVKSPKKSQRNKENSNATLNASHIESPSGRLRERN